MWPLDFRFLPASSHSIPPASTAITTLTSWSEIGIFCCVLMPLRAFSLPVVSKQPITRCIQQILRLGSPPQVTHLIIGRHIVPVKTSEAYWPLPDKSFQHCMMHVFVSSSKPHPQVTNLVAHCLIQNGWLPHVKNLTIITDQHTLMVGVWKPIGHNSSLSSTLVGITNSLTASAAWSSMRSVSTCIGPRPSTSRTKSSYLVGSMNF